MTRIILLRHGMHGILRPVPHPLGQSEYTAANKFAGWADIDLSPQGEEEAQQAGRLIRDLDIDYIHISALRRTAQTLEKIRPELSRSQNAPVHSTWRLNERHYGQLEGCNKIETAKIYGVDQVRKLRRDWDTRPPPVTPQDPRWPKDLSPNDLSPTAQGFSESPADCYNRLLPYLEDVLVPLLRKGNTILVIAHGTSLRCIIKFFLGLQPDEMRLHEIPSGVPVVYEIDPESLKVTRIQNFVNEAEIQRRRLLVAKESEPAH